MIAHTLVFFALFSTFVLCDQTKWMKQGKAVADIDAKIIKFVKTIQSQSTQHIADALKKFLSTEEFNFLSMSIYVVDSPAEEKNLTLSFLNPDQPHLSISPMFAVVKAKVNSRLDIYVAWSVLLNSVDNHLRSSISNKNALISKQKPSLNALDATAKMFDDSFWVQPYNNGIIVFHDIVYKKIGIAQTKGPLTDGKAASPICSHVPKNPLISSAFYGTVCYLI